MNETNPQRRLITVSDDQVFALSNDQFSYVFRVSSEGILEHVYYGEALRNPLTITPHHIRTDRGATSHFEGQPYYNLNDTPQEYPCFGTSDYRSPAFHAQDEDGFAAFTLRYKSHEIRHEKPLLGALPCARGGGSETLILTLGDSLHKLTVELHYTVYEHHGVLARSSKIINSGTREITLKHVFSTALDLPADDYDILHLHGTWSREFNAERLSVPKGRFSIDSARGTSSAAHNPFIAVMSNDTSEDNGRVYGAAVMYSGNFSMSVETGEFGDVRLLAGLNPFNFCWRLEPEENFQTPEALQVFTPNGLRGMSHIWHDFIRDKISPERFKKSPRPSYLNTWEAAYFDINEDKVLTLADKAKDIGVDMLVLDDGWFEGRCDDSSSLGDWTADRARFPSGIPALAAKVKATGLKFGIWFEPEMVSPNSQLYRAHPDWVLHVPGRVPSLGRNQLTLDLSRAEVVDNIYHQIDAILSCGHIDYVKWDMNRNMTDVGSAAPGRHQSETPHRYMLGLYALLSRLMEAYPDVLFENCASGGNRFDLGMLNFMAQGWVSDMCDPIGRLDIINGASYLYPLDTMAAYIGPSPNHQNGRISSMQTRFHAGLFCAARGVSLSEHDIEKDKAELQHYMAFVKATQGDMIGGRFDRLFKNDNEVCWQYTAVGGETVYLAYFHILSAPNLPFRRAHLAGLDPQGVYILAQDSRAYDGDALMRHGIAMPYVNTSHVSENISYMPNGDFSSHVFVFNKTPSEASS